MLMMLSPAKTFKTIELEPLDLSNELIFKNKTKQLVNQLQTYSVSELSTLMKMSEALAEVNVTRFAQFYEKNQQGMYAIHAFEGEAYKGLDSLSLNQEALEFSKSRFEFYLDFMEY